jgi:uncharacterized protein
MKSRILAAALLPAALVLSTPQAFAAEPPAAEAVPESGEAEAQYQLARAHLRGEGVPKNPAKAFDLMKLAAAQGHAEALGGVGYFHATGLTVPRNDAEAVRWYRKGAEKGGAKAQLNLGLALAAGRGAPKREEEGLQWIDRAAEQGLADALHAQGEIHFHGRYGRTQDYRAAFAPLLRAAEAGHAAAQNTLGVMMRDGLGLPAPDAAGGERWFRAAAEQGHARAQSSLGHLLGPDGPEASKRVEALKWLLLASFQNEATALKTLHEITPNVPAADLAEARKQAAKLQRAPLQPR